MWLGEKKLCDESVLIYNPPPGTPACPGLCGVPGRQRTPSEGRAAFFPIPSHLRAHRGLPKQPLVLSLW